MCRKCFQARCSLVFDWHFFFFYINLNVKLYVQILLFPIAWCLKLLIMSLLYSKVIYAESYEFACRLVHVRYCYLALCACIYVSGSTLPPSFLSNWNVLSGKLAGGACVILWAAVKWRIDAFSVPFYLLMCVCAHPRLGVCVLVLAATGYLEVFSHTGAAINPRHFLLLPQHSTLFNKVCPRLRVWASGRGGNILDMGRPLLSVYNCADSWYHGGLGTSGYCIRWNQAALNPPWVVALHHAGALLLKDRRSVVCSDCKAAEGRLAQEPPGCMKQRYCLSRREEPSRHVFIRGNAKAQPVFMRILHLSSTLLIKARSVALERQKRPSECSRGTQGHNGHGTQGFWTGVDWFSWKEPMS